MIRSSIHMLLHLLVPALVARYGLAQENWKKNWLIMLSAMIIDLDHLLASPIFDPNRSSVGFHPLHSYVAVSVYIVVALTPKTRVFGIGLLIHIVLDWIDCVMMH